MLYIHKIKPMADKCYGSFVSNLYEDFVIILWFYDAYGHLKYNYKHILLF
jgi:hypothetical protein